MQEAEAVLRIAIEPAPVVARGFEQRQGADDIGLHERSRAVDRAIHVRLGREIHDRIRAMFEQQLRHQRSVADIAMYEHVVRIRIDRGQGIAIARVRQGIEVDHTHARRHCVEHEIAADEAGAAGDQPGTHAHSVIACATHQGRRTPAQ